MGRSRAWRREDWGDVERGVAGSRLGTGDAKITVESTVAFWFIEIDCVVYLGE
jgi:hypothetical protein